MTENDDVKTMWKVAVVTYLGTVPASAWKWYGKPRKPLDSWCPGGNSNQALSEQKSEATA
jgi:hypothetical protein